ncbi:MAG: fibronectin type III domain-containing protein, partial [Acidimicrobiales bacterium]
MIGRRAGIDGARGGFPRRGIARRAGRAFVASLAVVAAVVGAGLSSAGSAGATIFTFKPSSPTIVGLQAGNGNVRLVWSYPYNLTPFTVSGPSSTTSFGVCWSTDSTSITSCTSPQATFTSHEAGSPTSDFAATVGPLANGVTYHFVVVAHNSYGYSSVSNSQTATPGRVPTTPKFTLENVSTSLEGAVDLYWGAPTGGGFPVTKYFVCWSSTAAKTYTCSTTTIKATHETIYATLTTQTHAYETVEVSGLALGRTYFFEVVAVTQFGESEGLSDLQTAIPSTVPAAPVLETAVPADHAVLLKWSTPATRGAAIASYRICWAPAIPVNCVATRERFWTGSIGPVPYTVTGLTNGTPEYFTVAAANIDGYSTPSAPVAATAQSVPGTPLLTATASNHAVNLRWTVPTDGGSPITGYGICWSTTENGAYTECRFHTPQKTVGPTVTTYTVPSLTDGTAYSFAVIAENADGKGAPSFTFVFATPSTVPSQPVISSAVAVSSGDVALRWHAPTDGGSTISYYWICWSQGAPPTACPTTGRTARQVGGGDTTNDITLTGLQLGGTYYFVVTAQNADGYSAPSLPSPPVVPSSLPTHPVLLPAVTGSSTFTISWVAPTNDGGSPIDGYGLCWGVTPGTSFETPCEAGTQQWSILPSTTRSYTLSGLANGTRYWYSIIAENANGQSGPTSGEATPSALSTPPVLQSAVGGNGEVTLHWAAPSATGGLPVTGYGICYSAVSTP